MAVHLKSLKEVLWKFFLNKKINMKRKIKFFEDPHEIEDDLKLFSPNERFLIYLLCAIIPYFISIFIVTSELIRFLNIIACFVAAYFLFFLPSIMALKTLK